MNSQTWRTTEVCPALAADAVHVWRIPLAVSDSEQGRRAEVLSSDEQARAARLHFERDRRRWIATRGAVRALLAGYTGAHAVSVRFRLGPHGKPSLEAPAGTGLEFNVSHSGELALCAVSLRRAVGVDVEAIRPEFATASIAGRFFAPAERAAFEALPRNEQTEAFFACWSRKEAYMKARGTGIALGLDRFEVSLTPGRPAALLATHDEPDAVERWRLATLAPGVGYAGALVTDGPARLECWEWVSSEMVRDTNPTVQDSTA
jgi:4'-phosphopantetheinyl transferase